MNRELWHRTSSTLQACLCRYLSSGCRLFFALMDASIHVSLFHRQIVAVSRERALAGTSHRGGALHSTVTCLESAKRLKKAHIRFGIAPWHAPTQCGLVECEFFRSRASHVDSRELTLGLPDVPDSIGNSSLTPL